MNRATMQQVMYSVFNECDALRQAGQKEYAHDDSNAFANFERLADSLQLDRKQVLLVYAHKHWDGIASFVAGHTSQREDVRGRINDLIVYMTLLRGMIDEEQALLPNNKPSAEMSPQVLAMQQNVMGSLPADPGEQPFVNKPSTTDQWAP